MGSAKHRKRQSKYQDCEFILQWLRYALANKKPLIHVVAIRSSKESSVSEEFPSTDVMIRLPRFPENGPLGPSAFTCFLESWPLQQEFLAWCGKQVAAKMPIHSKAMKKLKSGLSNLKVGRTGTLPPRMILVGQYKRLLGELRVLNFEFPDLMLPITKDKRESILKFGQNTSASWLQFVKENKISLDEFVTESAQPGAKLILSKQYRCSEDSIHSRLFRKG
jgi:hypothetical protein